MAPLTFYKDRSEYFLDLGTLLFFETDGKRICGHTRNEAYEVKQKLYELEELLPIAFCRISKSAIVNGNEKKINWGFLNPSISLGSFAGLFCKMGN